jgi:hypothetical protein
MDFCPTKARAPIIEAGMVFPAAEVVLEDLRLAEDGVPGSRGSAGGGGDCGERRAGGADDI